MKKTSLSLIALMVCLFLFSGAGPASAAPIRVPIHVQEALPANVTNGWVRTAEPVKVGVPLLDSDGISNVNQLTLEGVSACQFRVLERFPSGNIRWVLCDFQTDLSANQKRIIYLTNGTPTAGTGLAVDAGSTVAINTGAMQVVIQKHGKNILDRAMVGGVEYISPGNQGQILLERGDGVVFSSLYSTNTVEIEENGPLRATVKINGVLQNQAGNDFCMRFILRLHFYKDKAFFRSFFTIAHDTIRGQANRARPEEIRKIEWVLGTNLNHTAQFTLSGTDGAVTHSLAEPAYLLQGYSDFRSPFQSQDLINRWIPNNGYRIGRGSSILNNWSGSDTTKYACGFADLTQGNTKMVLAFRSLSGFWGGGFELRPDGRQSFALMSGQKGSSYRYSFYAHETRELAIGFGQSSDGSTLENTLNYPVFGLPDLEQIRRTGAVWGQTRIPSEAQTRDFYNGITGSSHYQSPNPSEWNSTSVIGGWSLVGPRKRIASSTGGPDGNTPFLMTYLLKMMQTGQGGYFLLSHYLNNMMVDYPIQNAHDFNLSDLGSDFLKTLPFAGTETCNGIGIGYKYFLEIEHPHWLSIVPWYYLTGDERIRENWR
ncbi:MAG: hypothetical protein EHM45_21085, partial [Desulfobacteraceae bacterium]